MNLRELQTEVENAIRATYEHGENPEDVIVTLQVDDPEDPHHGYACGTEEVTLHYDGNCQASGCVLQAWSEPDNSVERVLHDAGYKTVSGADNVLAAIAAASDGSTEQRCSGYGVFPGGEKCGGCGDCKPNDKSEALT